MKIRSFPVGSRPPGPPPGPMIPSNIPTFFPVSSTKNDLSDKNISEELVSNSSTSSSTLLVCDCGIYRTAKMEKLKVHINAVHNASSTSSVYEWQYCGECDHRFKFWEDLKVHINAQHDKKGQEMTW